MSDQKRKRDKNDFTVALAGKSFDLTVPSEALSMARAGDSDEGPVDPDATGPDDTRLVQFLGPLTEADKDRLRRTYGLALTAYIANHTYVERVAPGLRAALARDSRVRVVAPYLPEYKLSPLIADSNLQKPEEIAADKLQLDASLFDRGDTDAVVATLESMGATDFIVLDDRALGGIARVRFTIDADADLAPLTALADVRYVEPVPRLVDDNVAAASSIQSGDSGNASIWGQGLHGEGQIVGVMDNGPLDIGHCFFADAAPNTPGAAHRKVVALRNASGSAAGGHATFVSGCVAGDERNNSGSNNRRGGAWAARLVSGNRNDLGANSLLAELTSAMNSGALIHTNSWHDSAHGAGNPAPYNQNAADVDNFTFNNENHIVFGSSGNNGEEQGAPGTAKNAVCVSAAQSGASAMNMGDGNPGPTADGRMKPDIVTVGCAIESATVNTPCGTGPRSDCATSYATPHAAAAAALIRQYFTEGWYPTGAKVAANAMTPTGALLKAMLVNSTVDMTGVPDYPNQTEGWGLVRLQRALFFAGARRSLSVFDVRHAAGPTTGDTRTHQVTVADDSEQLKVVLVFNDPPGNVGSNDTAVNDLDLTVTAPDGTVYVGNDFTNGLSTANSTDPGDPLATVEVVVVDNPAAGTWTITVDAFEVAVGNPGQGYAVVAASRLESGCFVAGAVYGDSEHPDVEALRAWRNRHRERILMRLAEASYAQLGPQAARLVRRWPALRRRLRTRTLPWVVNLLVRRGEKT